MNLSNIVHVFLAGRTVAVLSDTIDIFEVSDELLLDARPIARGVACSVLADSILASSRRYALSISSSHSLTHSLSYIYSYFIT